MKLKKVRPDIEITISWEASQILLSCLNIAMEGAPETTKAQDAWFEIEELFDRLNQLGERDA